MHAHSSSFRPRRSLTSLTAVVALHLLLLWAILQGFGSKVIDITENTVAAVLLSADPPAAAPPVAVKPPPKPTPTPVPTPVPTPTPSVTAAPAITPSATPAAAAPAAATAAPTHTAPSSKPSGNCEEPAYPSASRRLEEEGTVTLKFLISVDGKVKEALIDKSSNYPRLDNAAKNALAKCQFRPGTVNGQPEESWATIRYTWRLD